MGTIVKRGDVYHIVYRQRGKQCWETTKATDKEEAERLLKERMEELGLDKPNPCDQRGRWQRPVRPQDDEGKQHSVVPLLLDTRAAAEYLGISARTMEAYIANGVFELIRLPRPDGSGTMMKKNLIRREELDRFVREQIKRV